MNILLIQPPIIINRGEVFGVTPPLGFAYLASIAEKNGHNVKILDYTWLDCKTCLCLKLAIFNSIVKDGLCCKPHASSMWNCRIGEISGLTNDQLGVVLFEDQQKSNCEISGIISLIYVKQVYNTLDGYMLFVACDLPLWINRR